MATTNVVYSESALARFWARIDKNGPVPPHRPDLGGCWIWTGTVSGTGYGKLSINCKQTYVHRLAWEVANSKPPSDMWVLHACDNPKCVNPGHLFLGTSSDNARDRSSKGRNNSRRGSDSPSALLNEVQVEEILKAHRAGGISQHELARRYGVTHSTIWMIVHGKSWAHVQMGE